MRAPYAVRRAPGVTLLELLVVLTILGLVLGVTGVALSSLKTPPESEQLRDLEKARADAIQSGVQRTAYGSGQTGARSGRELTHSPEYRLRSERGVVLLEVLVALTVLSVGALALVESVDAGLQAERRDRQREAVLASEERLLHAMTLLRRAELDQRLGRRPIGEFIVDVQRPEPTLYRIGVLQSDAPTVEDLVTVVYRQRPAPTQ